METCPAYALDVILGCSQGPQYLLNVPCEGSAGHYENRDDGSG